MKKIYLSPSNQTGNKYCTGNTNEGAVQNEIAKLLVPMLQKYECEVKLCDMNKTLAQRAAEAKEWGANVYIAMHSNAAGTANSGARGVSVYYGTKVNAADRRSLAETMLKNLAVMFKNRGTVISNTLIDCNTPVMPSVICEVGFHDNIDDARLILNNKEKVANLYCNGIVEYLGLKKKEETPVVKPAFDYYYVVNKNDWLSKIASKFSTTVSALAKANNISNPNVINIGQKIGIPGAFVYSVKKGDTLGAIAKKYGTTVSKLVKANGIVNANIIRVAQQLVIVK